MNFGAFGPGAPGDCFSSVLRMSEQSISRPQSGPSSTTLGWLGGFGISESLSFLVPVFKTGFVTLMTVGVVTGVTVGDGLGTVGVPR